MLAACVTHVPLSLEYRGPADLPATAFVVEQDDEPPLVELGDTRRRLLGGVTFRRLTVRSGTSGATPVELEYYDPDGSEATPVVILLPIFDGELRVPRFFARYFASRGWAAVVVHRSRDPLVGLSKPEEMMRANLNDYGRVLDWVERQPDLDADRIGLFGISFGAMDAIVLAALDDRVDAIVAAMAGGDLPDVMVNTHYRPVVRTIDSLIADQGLTRDGLRASLDERLVTDPLELAPYVDVERVLMIVTRTDAIVPFEAQQALRAEMGTPETLYLPTGHRTSALYLPKVRSVAYDFFARQFAAEPVAAARE
jgi:dienelactone hydrolase